LPKIRYKYKSVVVSDKPYKYDLMPIIPITISHKEKKLNVEALIDSGANRCFCPVEIGQALKIPLEECSKSGLSGIGGSIEIFIHQLDIGLEYGKFKFSADVGFGEFSFPGFSFILGQKDFFENVNIFFERRKEHLELHLPK